jgi:hypothetical protein
MKRSLIPQEFSVSSFWVGDWGFRQGLAVTLVMSARVGALLGSLTLAGREVGQLLEEVPGHESNLRQKARYVHSFIVGTGVWQRAIDTLQRVEQEVRDPETESKPVKIEVAPNQPLATAGAWRAPPCANGRRSAVA